MDIRELYKSLSPEDRIIYQKLRTDMRKLYLNAHNSIVGVENWSLEDDALLDLFDIKIAVLFDRAGSIEGLKPVVDKSFPLREAAAAHERLEKSEQFGKVILNP